MDKFWRELANFRLGFLQTDNVVLGFMKPVEKAFALGGANSIDVPGDEGEAFGHVGTLHEVPTNCHCFAVELLAMTGCYNERVLDPRASLFVRERLKGVSLIDTPMDVRCHVCVVLPVYSEPVHRVVNLLVSLARQRAIDPSVVEVICVVNRGPDDGSKAWKKAEQSNQLILDLPVWRNRSSFGGHLRFPLDVLDASAEVRSTIAAYAVEMQTSGNGMVGEALNRGLAEATVRFDRVENNGIVIFFGADNVVDDPDYFAKALQLFQRNPKLVAASGGVRLLFDPDTRDEQERIEIAELVERFLRRKKLAILQRFIQGLEIGLMKDDAFLGSNMLARSADAAAWGGFPDWKRNEDSAFGYAAKRYGEEEGKEVRDVKQTLSITSALRDSDRTGSSLKAQLEKERAMEPISVAEYEKLEQQVGATKEGRELIDRIEEPANILWDNYLEK